MHGAVAALPLIVALLAAPVTVLVGVVWTRMAGRVATALAGLAFVTAVAAWARGGGTLDVAWAPARELRFAVSLDAFGALYTVLATGIGFLVLAYSTRYVPLHLRHQGRPRSEETRFHAFMLLFMGSMVGLAMAQDLILLFVFWDITAIASYYLIGFDRHDREARASALMALIVTGGTAVLLLIGALVLYGAYGTFSVPELAQRVRPGPALAVAGLLIVVAALAKSAQVPFHFWLPRAMAAPTPVSAYLHSAAMVAAGVLLIGRVYPLLRQSPAVLLVLLVVGVVSIVVGAVLALTRDVLKQLLAYSTISQYGYVVFMYGVGGTYGAAGAVLYVMAHALAKSALFLVAGAVTEATGAERLSDSGGLARRMPVLAVAGGLAAASVVGLPLTVGFFGDEMLFDAALHRGPLYAGLAVGGAVLTLTYMWRFWSGLFLGPARGEPARAPAALVWPVAVLGAVVLIGGITAAPFARLSEAAGAVSYAAPTPIDPAYHFDARPVNLMTAAMILGGVAAVLARPAWRGAVAAVSGLGRRVGPERQYAVGLAGLNRLSDWVHDLEVRDLRGRVAAVLVPGAALVAAGVLAAPAPTLQAFRPGEVSVQQLPVLLALIVAATAAVAATVIRRHVTLALVLSSSGLVLALVYAFLGAPEVALVAVLVETLLTLFLLGAAKLIPARVLLRQAELPVRKRRRTVVAAAVAGTAALAVVWGALSQPSAERSVAARHLRLAPEAHATDVVTAVIADFRGLDTLGEITVVGTVLLGVITLLGGGRFAVPEEPGAHGPAGALPRMVSKLILMPTLLVALALLVKGYSQTGDGFSAGVVAALGVVLQYLVFGRQVARTLPFVRFAGRIAFVGLLIALAVAGVPVLLGDPVLTHYPAPGVEPVHFGKLEFVTALLYDLGVFLLVFGFVVSTVSMFGRAITGEEKRRGAGAPAADDAMGARAASAGRERP